MNADRALRVLGYAVVVSGCSLSLSFGDRPVELSAYALSVALGVVLYYHANSYGSRDTYIGGLAGFLAGVALSEAAATALVTWYFAVPVDAAAWLMGVRLMFGWIALAFCFLTGFFVTGLAQLLE